MGFDFGLMDDTVLATFGDEVTVFVYGTTKPIPGIYDSRHYAVDEGVAGGSARLTTLSVDQADAVDLEVGVTELTVTGKPTGQEPGEMDGIYRLSDKRPAGGKMVVLDLERIRDA